MRNTTYEFFSIGAVDPDYKHVWGFATKAERETFLMAHLGKTITNNTYWRPVDHTIKANFSINGIPLILSMDSCGPMIACLMTSSSQVSFSFI